MQGSSETVGESTLYEVAGTISELLLADQLLRSRAPVFHQIQILKWVSVFAAEKTNKILPEALTHKSGEVRSRIYGIVNTTVHNASVANSTTVSNPDNTTSQLAQKLL